jgi:cob(I)alamin adenosyltransferase
MSIATKRGDSGKTDLVGRIRVSKAELRVECYGTIDELNACSHGILPPYLSLISGEDLLASSSVVHLCRV